MMVFTLMCILLLATCATLKDTIQSTNTINFEIMEPRVGLRFSSDAEWEKFLDAYEKQSKQKFYVQSSEKEGPDCRTKRKLKKGITFQHLNLVCRHGKNTHNSHDEEQQSTKNTRSKKMGCEARIRLHATRNGDQLVISQVYLQHKDHLDTDSDPLPGARSLTPEQLEEIRRFISVKSSRPHVIAYIKSKYNVELTSKDLKNIEAKMKKPGVNQIEDVLEFLKTKGARVDLLTEKDVLQGIFLTNREMRVTFRAYGTLVFFDATYKLMKNGFILIPFFVEDGNCLTEWVAMAIVRREDKPTIRWVFECFKKHHGDAIDPIRFFMCDKDPNQRAIVKSFFPHARLLICWFHVNTIFEREVGKMDLTADEKTKAELDMKALAKAKNERNYQVMWSNFQKNHPTVVTTYMLKNWHDIHQEWSCFEDLEETYGNRTNNRSETMNEKLKKVVRRKSTLSNGVKSVFVCKEFHEGENKKKIKANFGSEATEKVSEVESRYRDLLLDGPFSKLQEEFRSKNYISFDKIGTTMEITKAKIVTTSTRCNCGFFHAYHLPCAHIFATRERLKLPLYDESLCLARWTKAHCKQHHRLYSKVEDNAGFSVTINEKKYNNVSEYTETKIDEIIADFAEIISLSVRKEYEIKLVLIHEVISSWSNKINIDIVTRDSKPLASDLAAKKENLNIHIKEKGKSDCQKRWKEAESVLLKLKDFQDEPVHCIDEKIQIFHKIQNAWDSKGYAEVCQSTRANIVQTAVPTSITDVGQLRLPPSPKVKGRPRKALATHTKSKAKTQKQRTS